MRMKTIISLLSVLLLVATARGDVAELVDLLLAAHAQKQPIPVLSEHHPTLDEKTAYQIQKAYVQQRLLNERIAGFKAGLTSQASQQRFGVDTPVAGVLFVSGRRNGRQAIDADAFQKLMIETEIGFLVASPITEPMETVGELREHILHATPVIELPDTGFADLKKVKGVDLIAANVGAALFLAGQTQEAAGLDLRSLTVTLSRDGEIINRGTGSEALGDPWNAALWLVNSVLVQGWTIAPGQILLSGSLGQMVPAVPGRHTADFGALGTLSFELR